MDFFSIFYYLFSFYFFSIIYFLLNFVLLLFLSVCLGALLKAFYFTNAFLLFYFQSITKHHIAKKINLPLTPSSSLPVSLPEATTFESSLGF